MHTPDKLLQLPHAGSGFEVFYTWLPICPDVDVELGLISLGVYHAWLAGQDEWAQPDGIDLGRSGCWALVLHGWVSQAHPTRKFLQQVLQPWLRLLMASPLPAQVWLRTPRNHYPEDSSRAVPLPGPLASPCPPGSSLSRLKAKTLILHSEG